MIETLNGDAQLGLDLEDKAYHGFKLQDPTYISRCRVCGHETEWAFGGMAPWAHNTQTTKYKKHQIDLWLNMLISLQDDHVRKMYCECCDKAGKKHKYPFQDVISASAIKEVFLLL